MKENDKKMLPRNDGRFVVGHAYSPRTQIQRGERRSPSTEIRRGQHLSRETEFKHGQCAHNKLPVGSVTVRVETHTKLPRAWVKVSEPNVWKKRAVIVWEALHGPLPRGHVVHHKDRNTLNDDPANLVGLTRGQHADEHRGEIEDARATASAS